MSYGGSSRELAVALGAKDLGYSLTSVDPGRRSCPFHFHHSEEEVFYVLEGRAQLRQGEGQGDDELIALGPGDCVSFPAGTGLAHGRVPRLEQDQHPRDPDDPAAQPHAALL